MNGPQRAAILIAGRVGGAVFATAWMVVAARVLDAPAFGGLAVVVAIGTVAAVIAEGGYPVLVAAAVGGDPAAARQVVRGALRVRLPLALAAGAATAGGGALVGGALGAATGAVYGGWILASAAQTTIGAALRGLGCVGAEAVGELSSRALALIVGMPLLAIWPSPVAVALAYAIGAAVAVASLAVALRQTAPKDEAGLVWCVPLRRSATLGLVAVLATLYNRVDLWVLALIGTSRDAGVYAAAYRFYEGLVLPSTAFGALLVPAAARVPQAVVRNVLRHLTAALLITGAGALTVALAAPSLVRVLLGSPYAGAMTPLRLLAVAAVPAAILTVVAPLASITLRGAGSHLYAGGILLATVTNIALVPSLGPAGSAAAMIATQSVLAVVFLRRVLRAFGALDPTGPGGTPPAGTPAPVELLHPPSSVAPPRHR